jgi:hypothetical protein
LKWLSESEALALRTFAHDGGAEVAALDRACGLLLQALRSAPTKSGEKRLDIDAADLDSDQPAELAFKAHILLGARTLQVARAYRALLASGYEHEGNALIRTMIELIAHRQAFEDDPTGQEGVPVDSWAALGEGAPPRVCCRKLLPDPPSACAWEFDGPRTIGGPGGLNDRRSGPDGRRPSGCALGRYWRMAPGNGRCLRSRDGAS